MSLIMVGHILKKACLKGNYLNIPLTMNLMEEELKSWKIIRDI